MTLPTPGLTPGRAAGRAAGAVVLRDGFAGCCVMSTGGRASRAARRTSRISSVCAASRWTAIADWVAVVTRAACIRQRPATICSAFSRSSSARSAMATSSPQRAAVAASWAGVKTRTLSAGGSWSGLRPRSPPGAEASSAATWPSEPTAGPATGADRGCQTCRSPRSLEGSLKPSPLRWLVQSLPAHHRTGVPPNGTLDYRTKFVIGSPRLRAVINWHSIAR